ncbi:MAG: hypothetical protein ACK4OE_14445 [Acidovorax sp.]|uniref:hypothetical protein n=1 Tax=Acidovorax sp. TaxID=1872122 RepID=UPI003918F981
MSTLSTLPAPLRALSRWLQQNLLLETEEPACNAPAAPPSAPVRGRADMRDRGAALGSGATANPASPSSAGSRPLRGNWPFNVRPPVTAPQTPVGPSTGNNRSFLPTSSMGSRDAFIASLSSNSRTNQSARVLRRVCDAGTGKLVIAGRMADVCAELDRMAALEGLQTR